MDIGSILFRFIGRAFDIFKQKVYVYVEVSFNHDPPFCVVVKNRSNFEVLIDRLIVQPDGFPKAREWLAPKSEYAFYR
ncbi:MAG: hypothetical protein ACU826_02810 [Gammaproteobacteria bacterium]